MSRLFLPQRRSPSALRLIRQLIKHLGPGAELDRAEEREWASATFSGARHSLWLNLPIADATCAIAGSINTLPDHEFDLAGEIVADCSVSLQPRRCDANGQWWEPVVVEILTVSAD